MKEKSPTELYFDEIISEIHQMLKPLGFEKKDLNFYREQDFFRQIFNIELWHSYSENYIRFTINIGTDYSTDKKAVFDDIQYFRHRENINQIIGDKGATWYELNGEMLDKSQINAHFSQTKNFVLTDIKNICQTLFKIIKDETSFYKIHQRKYFIAHRTLGILPKVQNSVYFGEIRREKQNRNFLRHHRFTV